jgi:hypothetical protein
MVRTFTDLQEIVTAQWRAAWALLSSDARRRIAEFCARADADIAAAVLKGTI